LERLDKNINVDDPASSYARFLLSKYMLENFEFNASRKMAGLSMRYDFDKNFNYIKQQQFEKAEWFYHNVDRLLSTFELSTSY